jgi:hypothetical protein
MVRDPHSAFFLIMSHACGLKSIIRGYFEIIDGVGARLTEPADRCPLNKNRAGVLAIEVRVNEIESKQNKPS